MHQIRTKFRLFAVKPLCFAAHSFCTKRLEGIRATSEEARAFRAVERAMRYLAMHEPEIWRWERIRR